MDVHDFNRAMGYEVPPIITKYMRNPFENGRPQTPDECFQGALYCFVESAKEIPDAYKEMQTVLLKLASLHSEDADALIEARNWAINMAKGE